MKSSHVPILKFLRVIEAGVGGGGHAPISQKDTGVGWPTIEKSCTQHSQNDFWLAAHTLFATWTKSKKNVIVDYAVVQEYPLLMSKWWLILLFPSVIQSEQAWYNLKLRLIYTIQVFACLACQVLMISLWHILYCLNQTYKNLKYVVGLIYTNITTCAEGLW